MRKRVVGKNDLETSVIGLGGGQFAGSGHSVEEILEIYQTALENGVNFIDTAKDYGEERVGRALKKIPRDKFYISTKTLAKNQEGVKKDIEDSLEKLGLDKIDFYLMHNPMSVEDYEHRKREGVLEALREAKEQGLIGHIGVSCDYVEPLEIAAEDDVDVIMTHYNIGNTLAEEVIEKASVKGIGVIAAKPFAGGILVDPRPEVEEGKENEMTPERVLKFVLANENISSAVIGARYPWQIEECAEVGHGFEPENIDQEKIRKEALDFLGEDFCRDCRYCWPCEELGYEFNISEILRLLDRYEKYGFKRFPRIEFSRLPYKDKIDDIEKCYFDCPFGIGIQERLKAAKSELDLKVSKKGWIEELEDKRDRISSQTFEDVRSLKDKGKKEAIDKLHTKIIPSGRIGEETGILLIRGIHSFGTEDVVESIKVFT